MVEIKRRSRYISEADEQEPKDVEGNDEEMEEETPEEKEAREATEKKVSELKDKYIIANKQRDDAKKLYNEVKVKFNNNITQIKDRDVTANSADNKTQLVTVYNQLRAEKDKYEQSVKQAELNMIQISDQIAQLNGEISDNIVEFMRIGFSRNLFESTAGGNKTDELRRVIVKSFDEIPNLSYQPSDVRCRTYAKNIINFMNKQTWKAGENHWEDFFAFASNLIGSSTVSLGRNEIKKFFDNLKRNLQESDMFVWKIFGKVDEPAAQEPQEVSETVDVNEPDSWVFEDIPSDIAAMVNYQYSRDIDAGEIEIEGDIDVDEVCTIVVYDDDLADNVSFFMKHRK